MAASMRQVIVSSRCGQFENARHDLATPSTFSLVTPAPSCAHLRRRREQSALNISRVTPSCDLKAFVGRRTNVRATASVGDPGDGGPNEDRDEFDVSSNCVKPVFRTAPVAAPEAIEQKGNKVSILFLSEGNVCRSVYAEAVFCALLRQHGLEDSVICLSKGTRDYNVGEAVDGRAKLIAEEEGLKLIEGKVATVFDCANDIVVSDLILVMDKFTASDTLKEATVYEIINKEGMYSNKVRRLGEFCQKYQIEDIEDPLYGNMGGPEELASVRQVYFQVRDSCEGLIQYVLDVKAHLNESESLQDGVARALGRMDALNWLAPPMLSKA